LCMEDVAVSPPVGASVWEQDMFAFLTEHTRREGALLAEYVSVAEGTASRALSYLVNMLVEDERRHHRYFNELASSLKSDAELLGLDPVIPRLDFDRVEPDELLAETKRLLDHEKGDAVELKRLRKELRDLEDTTLWVLLVEVMMRDTEKHIAILRFVQEHAKKKRSGF
jgi:hypothetical protein